MTQTTLEVLEQHPALLVMDVQRMIVERYGAADSGLLDRLNTALSAARTASIPVIYAVGGFRDGFPEVSPRNKMFGGLRQSGALAAANRSAMEIHPAIAPQASDIVVTKHRVSAFAGSDLDMVLRAQGIDTLVLSGIATSGVVLSTLRYAADQDFSLKVLSDCCADNDPEVHRVLLEKLFPRQATVLTAAEWTATLETH